MILFLHGSEKGQINFFFGSLITFVDENQVRRKQTFRKEVEIQSKQY